MAMKRSEINASIDRAVDFFKNMRLPLPEWALWSPAEWSLRGEEYAEVRTVRLGWDVTDFGQGDLAKIGRTIFTLRNGKYGDPAYPKTYAEKAMYLAEGQRSIIHYHRRKREDIINRGGGNVLLSVWRAGADNSLSPEPFTVQVDGRATPVKGGDTVRLVPGQSICLEPLTYHRFWAEEGKGDTLSFEVSSTCDDLTDNYFYDPGERFPAIVPDEPARWVLCGEYPPSRA